RRKLQELGFDWAQFEATVTATGLSALRPDEPLDLAHAAGPDCDPATLLSSSGSCPTATEQMATARILDACANLAREAIRVVEDYCRFSLDDPFLSGEFKRLRHDLVQILASLSPSLLLEARDTLHDVGTGLSTPSEEQRQSLAAVVQANLKRLQEALRSLE